MKLRRNKSEERANKLLFSELPYFNFRGNLAFYHGQFNNSIPADWRPRRNLDKLNSLYDLDIFSLNSNLDTYLNTDFNLPNQRIQSRYFSPHSFKMFKQKLSENTIKSSFSIFHNNIVSINRNSENIELLLDELDFHFDVIGILEPKLQNRNRNRLFPLRSDYRLAEGKEVFKQLICCLLKIHSSKWEIYSDRQPVSVVLF